MSWPTLNLILVDGLSYSAPQSRDKRICDVGQEDFLNLMFVINGLHSNSTATVLLPINALNRATILIVLIQLHFQNR